MTARPKYGQLYKNNPQEDEDIVEAVSPRTFRVGSA
jgi:hypothetical protein